MESQYIHYALEALFGVAVYLIKTNYETLKERIASSEKEISHLKEVTIRKEDFREFKDELWTRLDKMELSFDRKLQGYSK
jgi:hypothetical protein